MASPVSAMFARNLPDQRRYPQIDRRDPAKSFFDLMLAGKIRDTDSEYGALSVAKHFPAVIDALADLSQDPTFKGQTTADKFIETVFENKKLRQFHLVKIFVLFLQIYQIDSQYAKIAEAIATLNLEPEEAEVHILTLFKDRSLRKFVKDLVTLYHRKEPLRALFQDLYSKITELGLEEEEALHSSDDSSDDEAAPPPSPESQQGGYKKGGKVPPPSPESENGTMGTSPPSSVEISLSTESPSVSSVNTRESCSGGEKASSSGTD